MQTNKELRYQDQKAYYAVMAARDAFPHLPELERNASEERSCHSAMRPLLLTNKNSALQLGFRIAINHIQEVNRPMYQNKASLATEGVGCLWRPYFGGTKWCAQLPCYLLF